MPARRRAAALAAALLAVLAGCSAPPAPHRTASSAPAPAPSSRTPLVVAALGDSISTGFDACDRYGECPTASWAVGADVDGIAQRLGRSAGRPVRTVLLATPGATVADLDGQVTAAIAARPHVATVLVGANDVCRRTVADMTPAAAFGSTATAALTRLTAALPGTTVLVASIPDVSALPSVDGANPTARFVWQRLGGCATALADPTSTAPSVLARRAAVANRIRSDDAGLAAACRALPRCVWDGGALTAFRPSPAELSPLDFFHPSEAGQRRLAALEWPLLEARLAGG